MGLILGSGSTKPQYPYDMWYGVQGDLTSKDYKLTRVGNLDLHRTLPIQKKLRRFVENTDGSVKYYLHQNDSRKKDSGAKATIDSTDGNVMLEKPKYYLRVEFEGTKWVYGISEYPLPGFVEMTRKTCSPWCATIDRDNNIAVSGCWLQWNGDELLRDDDGILKLADNAARFRGGNGSNSAWDGTYHSMLGMPRTSISKAGARPLCKNGTHLGVYRVYTEIAWLQRIEYASLHCQDTYNETLTADGFRQGGLGSGPAVDGSQWNTWGGYNPFVPCGVTAILGNNTGRIPYVIKGWLLADDVLIRHIPDTEGGRSIAYLCQDPTKFTSHSDNATTVPDGYEEMCDLPRDSGYILHFAISTNGICFPDAIGGSSNQGACDYYWHPGRTASGWWGCLLSASAVNGALAGFGYLYAYSRSSNSNANSGFRFYRLVSIEK